MESCGLFQNSQKSKKEKGITERNEVREEWDRNKGMKLIDDYDLICNHELGKITQVWNTIVDNQLENPQRKLGIEGVKEQE